MCHSPAHSIGATHLHIRYVLKTILSHNACPKLTCTFDMCLTEILRRGKKPTAVCLLGTELAFLSIMVYIFSCKMSCKVVFFFGTCFCLLGTELAFLSIMLYIFLAKFHMKPSLFSVLYSHVWLIILHILCSKCNLKMWFEAFSLHGTNFASVYYVMCLWIKRWVKPLVLCVRTCISVYLVTCSLCNM